MAAARSILTSLMSVVMSRAFVRVFMKSKMRSGPCEALDRAKRPMLSDKDAIESEFHYALSAVRISKSIVIIPGYGMALAQAQFQVVRLARQLEELGKNVRVAIHPRAGRMPSHMTMLLAEAGMDYGKLVNMATINPEFSRTDLAVIVGASDVVNPSAIMQEGKPMSRMPILMAHKADLVVVCNKDGRPGYSGVKNLLYDMPRTITLFGDAKETLGRLLEWI